jgi:hypothetical protein
LPEEVSGICGGDGGGADETMVATLQENPRVKGIGLERRRRDLYRAKAGSLHGNDMISTGAAVEDAGVSGLDAMGSNSGRSGRGLLGWSRPAQLVWVEPVG